MPKAPHLVQYQGSKRILANQILSYMPGKMNKLIEPFSGLAAISIAAAYFNRSSFFHINDLNMPLILMLKEVIEQPERLAHNYQQIWKDQFTFSGSHVDHFYHVRDKFNNGDIEPANMLYLLARCVKGSIRYGKNGKFNQSPDKRRNGTNPRNMTANILAVSSLLKDKVQFSYIDYKDTFELAEKDDLIYMDPPYQGVCGKKDPRYFSDIDFDDFCGFLEILNKKNIDYIISYDGECGSKMYGIELPENLKCRKVLLKAGRSTQQTLLGKVAVTYESLYISDCLYNKIKTNFSTQQLQLI